jgi:hypothetical protein
MLEKSLKFARFDNKDIDIKRSPITNLVNIFFHVGLKIYQILKNFKREKSINFIFKTNQIWLIFVLALSLFAQQADAQVQTTAEGVKPLHSQKTKEKQPKNKRNQGKDHQKKKALSKKIPKDYCHRGINKGKPKCAVKSGHITAYNIHTGRRVKDLPLTTKSGGLTKEGRKKMLSLLADPKTKKECPYGYDFNFDYAGSASWRMYDCYVQDRLIAYLYRVAHHFDSEVQIVSALRANERKTSRHHNGHAVDFKIIGVSAKEVFQYCKDHFPLVGIGYYPTSQFVHLDVGREDDQAFWIDSSGAGEEAAYLSGVSQEQKGVAKEAQPSMIKTIKKQLSKNYATFNKQKEERIARKKRQEAKLARKKAKEKAAKEKASRKKSEKAKKTK